MEDKSTTIEDLFRMTVQDSQLLGQGTRAKVFLFPDPMEVGYDFSAYVLRVELPKDNFYHFAEAELDKNFEMWVPHPIFYESNLGQAVLRHDFENQGIQWPCSYKILLRVDGDNLDGSQKSWTDRIIKDKHLTEKMLDFDVPIGERQANYQQKAEEISVFTYSKRLETLAGFPDETYRNFMEEIRMLEKANRVYDYKGENLLLSRNGFPVITTVDPILPHQIDLVPDEQKKNDVSYILGGLIASSYFYRTEEIVPFKRHPQYEKSIENSARIIIEKVMKAAEEVGIPFQERGMEYEPVLREIAKYTDEEVAALEERAAKLPKEINVKKLDRSDPHRKFEDRVKLSDPVSKLDDILNKVTHNTANKYTDIGRRY